MMVGVLVLIVLTIISVIGLIISWRMFINADNYDFWATLFVLFVVSTLMINGIWLAFFISCVDYTPLTDWWYSEVG